MIVIFKNDFPSHRKGHVKTNFLLEGDVIRKDTANAPSCFQKQIRQRKGRRWNL